MHPHYKAVSLALPILLPVFINAQIALPVSSNAQLSLPDGIPTTGCVGNPVGTAHFTSTYTAEQGPQSIKAGKFWEQGGDVWEFSIGGDDKNIVFSNPGVPGAGAGHNSQNDGAGEAQKALKLSNDKRTLTLSVPDSPLGNPYEIMFDVGSSSGSKVRRAPADAVQQNHAITEAPVAPSLTGAKFRPKPRHVGPALVDDSLERRAANAAKVDIVIKANRPCQGPTKSSSSVSGNKDVASLCSAGKITAGPDAWTTYEVPKYMSSILKNASPLNGIKAIKTDVNPPGAVCTYTAKCDSISCNDVRDNDSGSELSIQRYLGYTAIINFNNYLWATSEALFKAGQLAGQASEEIVKTFFLNGKSDKTWLEVIGPVAGMLGLVSGMLGPFASAASTAMSLAGGVVGLVASEGTLNSISGVEDKRVDKGADSSDFFRRYFQAADQGLSNVYDSYIGKDVSVFGWTGTDLAPKDSPLERNGLFSDGVWANSDHSQELAGNVRDNMLKMMIYTAINTAWVDSGAFIIYVPYGRKIKGPKGHIISDFDKDWCTKNIKEKVGKTVNCDAGGGMAQLLAPNGGNDNQKLSTPPGSDASFSVVPDSNFNVKDAIAGSVASWREGDFGYLLGDYYKDGFKSKGGISAKHAEEIAKIKVRETTAGIFNVPVCQTYDLRFFPAAWGESAPFCLACGSKVAVGGKKNSKVKFMDKAGKAVTKKVDVDTTGGSDSCSSSTMGTICHSKCPEVYTG